MLEEIPNNNINNNNNNNNNNNKTLWISESLTKLMGWHNIMVLDVHFSQVIKLSMNSGDLLQAGGVVVEFQIEE